jgi:hypothetical protein
MERRGVGILLLAAGAAIEAIGITVEFWQEQNVYTISQWVTLPTFLMMILGIPLISRGYARCVRNTGPTGKKYVIALGSLAGSLLLLGPLWWQLGVGLPSGDNFDLESYSALPLFFVGVSLLAQVTASSSFRRRDPNNRRAAGLGTVRPVVENPSGPHTRRAWFSVPLLAMGVILLGATAGSAGWLEQQVLNVNTVYLVVAIETGGSGAWFLLVGYSGLTRNLGSQSRRVTRIVGMACGAALVIGGIFRWWTTLWTDWVSVIGLVVFVISGAGVLILSAPLREGSAMQGPNSATDSQ